MLAHDAARSGATAVELRPPFARKWVRTFADEGLNSGVQPIISGGTLFIGTLKGTLHAIDAESGRDLWTFRAGGPILHAAAAGGGKVFFGAADGKIYAVMAREGAPAWTVSTGAAVWNAPALHDGLVLAGSRDGRLYAIEAGSGKVRWASSTGGPILSSPAVDAGRGCVYAGSEEMRIFAFSLADGRTLWRSEKLPGASLRGYHPVIAPDGSVMVTSAPGLCPDTIQQILLDMVREVFGNFASWRNKKDENERLRQENFALMEKPETYPRQMEYLRKRLAEQPAMQTFFVLDPGTGRSRFVVPVVHAESMNGPTAPPIVTSDGKIVLKYSALLRSRYGAYSPFLNVGELDPVTGHITPLMEQSRTYGWHDSLLLVHDEQSQISASGRILINTHQDNVNALDLGTRRGYGQPFCHNVHEAKPGEAAALWALHLEGRPFPMGWEWLARGTAVYGGGSVLDVPVAVAGDSFYFLPTHEINAGVTLMAYRMAKEGDAGGRAEPPTAKISDGQWKKIQDQKWDWDILEMARLKVTLEGLPGRVAGTRLNPLAGGAKIEDAEMDGLILTEPAPRPAAEDAPLRKRLADSVEELIGGTWRPLAFPAGKHPAEGYRIFSDPWGTVYTLALAFPHLPPKTQGRVRDHVSNLLAPDDAAWKKSYDPAAGEVRSAYDPPPDALMKYAPEIPWGDTGRLYPLWLWGTVSGDMERVKELWPRLKGAVRFEAPPREPDLGNARIAGLMAACRISKGEEFLPQTREALRRRLEYERAHTEGGLITEAPVLRTIMGRWHHLTPGLARLLKAHAGPIHRRLMEVYVDHHRPTWWLAWNVELLWRNESPYSLPSMSRDILSARALILEEPAEKLEGYLDIPWCRADEHFIQKLALALGR